MKTVKLYYKDSFIKDFESRVVKCVEVPGKKGRYEIVLSETAFFPEEGGQESDTGTMTCNGITSSVIHVTEDKEGIITHITDKPFDVGETVGCTLNWDKRFSNMQHHTAEHMMSGLIKKMFDKDNVGFHLKDGSAVFDIDGIFTDEELVRLEEAVNKAVTENIEIVTKVVNKDELQTISCRSKFYESNDGTPDGIRSSKGNESDPGSSLFPGERTSRNLLELPDEIRLVIIGDVDTCACCAPHVKTTGQIGLIKIMNAEHFRGGTRFTIVCGNAALKTMTKLRNDELEIMHMLSAKQCETPAAVKRLNDSLTSAKQSLYSKDEQIALMLMQHARTTGSRVLFCSDIDQNTARKCVNELIAEESNKDRNSDNDPSASSERPVFFFIGTDETGYRFIIGGGKDARETLAGLKEIVEIKGGGSNLMVSGTTSASRKEIETAVNSLQNSNSDPVYSGEKGKSPVTEPSQVNGTAARIVLASASPRRKELLSKLGVNFEVIVSDTDENIECADPCSLVKELALLKARDVYKKITDKSSNISSEGTAKGTSFDSKLVVIGADTVVDLNGTVLGKPKDKTDAERMLRGLSGNAHQVHTGIAVIVRDEHGKVTETSDVETSVVNVDALSHDEIEAYIASGEPFDKAGSYAIQGLFAPCISSIEGDYYNIVGLPLNKLYKILKEHIHSSEK